MANKTKENNEKDKIYYPTNDYLFKRIFGYKGNEKITQGLIETILEKKCKVIEVKSDEITERDLQSDKIGVLDVFVEEKDGTQTNIEMQVAEYKYIIDRVNSFKIKDTKTGKLVLTENLEIVIIELQKMNKYKIQNKKLESWLKFIKNPNSLGAKELGENKEIQKAKEEYDKVMADDHERNLIRLREKYWLDYNSMKNASYKSGKEDGIEERNEATELSNGIEQRNKTAE